MFATHHADLALIHLSDTSGFIPPVSQYEVKYDIQITGFKSDAVADDKSTELYVMCPINHQIHKRFK